jgi:hypothetical protein
METSPSFMLTSLPSETFHPQPTADSRLKVTHVGLQRLNISDERMSLSFIIAAVPRQRSHSQVRVHRDSWPHYSLSDSRLPPIWRARTPIYILPWTGWRDYTPRHWVPFSLPPTTRRDTVRSSTPPPHGNWLNWVWVSCYDRRSVGRSILA